MFVALRDVAPPSQAGEPLTNPGRFKKVSGMNVITRTLDCCNADNGERKRP